MLPPLLILCRAERSYSGTPQTPRAMLLLSLTRPAPAKLAEEARVAWVVESQVQPAAPFKVRTVESETTFMAFLVQPLLRRVGV
jgi:hypothetical protein